MMLSRLAAMLRAPGLSSLVELQGGIEADSVMRTLGHEPDAWVLGDSYDAVASPMPGAAPVVRVLAADGECSSSSDAEPQLQGDRTLLRVRAPESATPGLNWALGYDATRVLEAACDRSCLDWLLCIAADEEEDIRERIVCGIQGEAFRQNSQSAAALCIDTIECNERTTLVLPEACRVALATQSLPPTVDVMWRVAPFVRVPSALERCIAPRPYWISAASCADGLLLSRMLPRGSTWVAQLPAQPTPEEQASLLQSGCGGLALPWPAVLGGARGMRVG